MKLAIRAALALFSVLAFSSAFAGNIDFNGYYEGYYLYNNNTPQAATGDSAQNQLRSSDRNHNTFTTNMIELGAKGALTKQVGFTLEVGYGDMNDAIHHSDNENRDLVNQGYLSMTPNFLPWKIDIGRFYTHMGLETTKAKDNWNFSRSLTYTLAVPTWHEGVRAEIVNTPLIGVNGYIYNNGNNEKNDNNDGKTLGARVRYSPTRDVTINFNGIYGPEQTDTEHNPRMIHNVNAVWTLNSKLSLAGDVTYGTEKERGGLDENGKWTAVAAYIKYNFNSAGYIAGRLENMTDKHGLLIDSTTPLTEDVKVTSLTATLGWDQGDGLLTWAELRNDKASEDVLTEDHSEPSDSQMTALVGLTYSL